MSNLPDSSNEKARWQAAVEVDGKKRVLAFVFAASEEEARDTADHMGRVFRWLKPVYEAWVRSGRPVVKS